jgi:hypothetical protein
MTRAMPQETVESLLGRMLRDERFRERLFRRPRQELERYDLLEHERESLTNLERVQLLFELLSEHLDPRIVRG